MTRVTNKPGGGRNIILGGRNIINRGPIYYAPINIDDIVKGELRVVSFLGPV
jgi:hypothetical protein